MKYKKIELVPRWCRPEDTQTGWVILHSDSQKIIGVQHLQYIKIKFNGKKICCKVIGPGAQGRKYLEHTDLPENEQIEIVKESIFLDSYYKQRLNLPRL